MIVSEPHESHPDMSPPWDWAITLFCSILHFRCVEVLKQLHVPNSITSLAPSTRPTTLMTTFPLQFHGDPDDPSTSLGEILWRCIPVLSYLVLHKPWQYLV